MIDAADHRPLGGLAVTLVSGSDLDDCARVARTLGGLPPSAEPREVEFGDPGRPGRHDPAGSAGTAPGSDGVDFALELADWLAADSAAGVSGATVVVLEPAAEVMEVSLVLERALESRRPRSDVGIHDVVAVTSVAEVRSVLFGDDDSDDDGPASSEWAAGGDGFDALTTPGRLARRLEFASLIVLTDVGSLGGPPGFESVRALLSRLAPFARVLPPEALPSARRRRPLVVHGRAHRLGASMGWQQDLVEGAPLRASAGPISTHVFRDPRPFHPHRLLDAVTARLVPGGVGRIVRSRGFVSLATRPGRIGSWQTAGDVLDLDPTTLRSGHPESPIGQEIVFYGSGLDGPAIDDVLGRCLVGGSELVAGPAAWVRWPDPFPEWVIHHH